MFVYNLLYSEGFSEVMKTHEPESCKGLLKYAVTVDEADTVADTALLVQDLCQKYHWNLTACVCGGEAGVDLTDALSEELGLLSNGTAVSNRRDKKVQQELARAQGMRAVRQASGTSLEEVREFLQTEPYPLIIKPLDSAGSDGVKLCKTLLEAQNHVANLLGSEMVNGGYCEEVLCQEYLKGNEYVVDHVSRDGVHKTVMVWVSRCFCYDTGSCCFVVPRDDDATSFHYSICCVFTGESADPIFLFSVSCTGLRQTPGQWRRFCVLWRYSRGSRIAGSQAADSLRSWNFGRDRSEEWTVAR